MERFAGERPTRERIAQLAGGSALLSVEDLRAGYGKMEILHGVDLQIAPGRADRSYGIHVAQLAGVPGPVLERAREILTRLEAEHARLGRREGPSGAPPEAVVPSAAPAGVGPDERAALLGELSEIPVETMTPIDALNELARLRAKARGGGAR